jgi:hypothetical protein
MKIEGIVEMVEMFEYDKQTGIDIPNEKISQTPKSWKPIVNRYLSGVLAKYASLVQSASDGAITLPLRERPK